MRDHAARNTEIIAWSPLSCTPLLRSVLFSILSTLVSFFYIPLQNEYTDCRNIRTHTSIYSEWLLEKCSWHVDKPVISSGIVGVVHRENCLSAPIISSSRPLQLESAPILFVKKLNYRRFSCLAFSISLINLFNAYNAKPLSSATQILYVTTNSIVAMVDQLSSRAALL